MVERVVLSGLSRAGCLKRVVSSGLSRANCLERGVSSELSRAGCVERFSGTESSWRTIHTNFPLNQLADIRARIQGSF